MHRIRRVVAAAASVAVGVAVSGCGVYKDFTTSDFAKQDPDAIVSAASSAMRDVTSMRMTGAVRSEGNQFFIDLTMSRDDRCTGTFRFGGSHVDIRRLGHRVWLKGESGAYNRLSNRPLTPSALRRLSTAWLLVEDDKALLSACDLESFLDSFEVVDFGASPDKGAAKERKSDVLDEVPATVGDETDLSGQTVVPVSGRPGGTHEETSWVLSDAPHYVVRVESTATRDGGALAMSEFNEQVEVEAPDPKDVLKP